MYVLSLNFHWSVFCIPRLLLFFWLFFTVLLFCFILFLFFFFLYFFFFFFLWWFRLRLVHNRLYNLAKYKIKIIKIYKDKSWDFVFNFFNTGYRVFKFRYLLLLIIFLFHPFLAFSYFINHFLFISLVNVTVFLILFFFFFFK